MRMNAKKVVVAVLLASFVLGMSTNPPGNTVSISALVFFIIVPSACLLVLVITRWKEANG